MSQDKEYRIAFDGVVEGLPDISIDNFQDKTKKAYFLSHLHLDHMSGLINWDDLQEEFDWHAKIYMTDVTKQIFSNKYDRQFKKIQSIVKILDIGSHKIPIKREKVQLTLIRVDHMPGAVMFLFKTSEGKVILYTGDFVMNDARLNEFKKSNWLGKDKERIRVDLLYFDATFRIKNNFRTSLNKNVPDRAYCIKVAANKIRDWLDKDASNAVAIFKYYDYGYEDLFKGIYKQLGETEKICLLNEEQHKVYSNILQEDEKVYTTNVSSRIHICNGNNSNNKNDVPVSPCSVNGCDKGSKFMHINVYAFPGGMPMKPQRGTRNAYDLCFPTHSSDSQLKKFIDYINPKSAVPFPNEEKISSTPSRGTKRHQPGTPTKPDTNKIARLPPPKMHLF